MKVIIKSPCSASIIIQYGIKSWPIWESESGNFLFNYNEKEICLIIEGEANIKTDAGESYFIKSGDLVEFPSGLSCKWQITKRIKKHFRLGE